MNEIFVRTHNGLYRCGETVYGVIYLKIATPTAAFGVRLRFLGIEKYDLFLQRQLIDIPVDKFVTVHKRKWIDCDNIHVYRSEGGNPMAIDSYMFPFQMNLPQNLPGSCCYESKHKLDKTEIKYLAESEVLGCKYFKATQTFHIKHSPLEKPPKITSASLTFIGGNFFRRIKITVDASLSKPEYAINETVSLLLQFADLTKSRKRVEKISVKVIQFLKVNLKAKTPNSKIYSKSDFKDDFQSDDNTNKSLNDQDPSGDDGKPVVHPLLDGKCVLSRDLTITDNEILESGFTFFVPLSQAQENVIPTTKGHHIECSHMLKVEIAIEGMETSSLTLPFHCLYPKENDEWSSWQPPEWTYRCKLIKSPHVCSVPESILASEAFAGFPGFQAF